MVRIPSLSRRSEPAPTRDENLDGRIDGRDTQVTDRDDSTVTEGRTNGDTGRAAVADRDADQTTYRSAAATDDQPGEAERRRAGLAAGRLVDAVRVHAGVDPATADGGAVVL
ncbi:hypothetical protein ACWCO3_20620, partial [Micromonospora sp. NPDC002411]